ncbi:hypothetical protein [Pontiella sulfatireligans]|uniref:Uncharacterized protein n=1 Tax=Pontiella sulfatireligans TaxID=2750658 RepID=A0A6C2UTE1_9BACT|nr:hypothetical protein [Pontiella sulfatireligans]VGO22504.1 hypothetical protein SCARR_04587 [Pontiella sulfatireligans]
MNALAIACLYLALSLFGSRVQQAPAPETALPPSSAAVAPVQCLEERGDSMLFEISAMVLPFDRVIAAPFD